jgi:hypothetical protein
MLGEPASWGRWAHLLGRSASFWKSDTKRLYVQAKLADEGELCPPGELAERVQGLIDRIGIAGIVSYEPPWVTRVDVAVDAECESSDGKLLLDALEAVRLPNGWRTTPKGSPRSTVYFMARAKESVLARAYCRNLKTKTGEPYGRIRLEAEQRFGPKECPLEYVEQPAFVAAIWKGRYANLESRVTRLPREVQAMGLAERMRRGELSHGQAERLHLFLDLERLGLAKQCYRGSVYSARRREAAKLGYSVNEAGTDGLDVELADLLAEYVRAVDGARGCRPTSRRKPAGGGGT